MEWKWVILIAYVGRKGFDSHVVGCHSRHLPFVKPLRYAK